MSGDEKKVSYDFSEDYKNLPLKLRVKVITTARELLEIQEKNKNDISPVIRIMLKC